MTIGFLFWLLMILWLLFGAWAYWPDRKVFGGHFLLWLLLFLLGWSVFGFPIRG
ncbi:MAG: hypothetical protein QOF62_1508 [Pyrinomonadaceae bacterium]|jgi:hypothetical protein|nr:hypothetical protein [Pyrinomonadaceae bacterium]